MWEVYISNKEAIDYGTYATDKTAVKEYIKIFEEMENNPNTIEFRKKG